MKEIRALMLAAGEGSRLRPLTDETPKPMLKVAGLPILEHNIRLMVRYGIKEIAINLHYKPEVITGYFHDGEKLGCDITYSREERLLGTAGALLPLEAFFSSTFVILYGDNIFDIDLTDMIHYHEQKGGILTMAAYYRDDVVSSGILDFDSGGRITRFKEKPGRDEVFKHWVNAGVLICERAILEYIPGDRPSDFGVDVIPMLIERGEEIFAYTKTKKLLWIDTPDDYMRVNEAEKEGRLHIT